MSVSYLNVRLEEKRIPVLKRLEGNLEFEDSFVKKFLKEIDGSTVLFGEALKDYRGRGISTEMISTGCKTLCCIYYHGNDTVFYGSGMGDNCIPFLMEIAARNDITIVLEHYMDFPSEYFEKNLVSIN